MEMNQDAQRFYGRWRDAEKQLEDALSDLKAAKDRISELERVINMVEFGGDWELQWCLWCKKESNINDTENLHHPDCPRQKVLGEP